MVKKTNDFSLNKRISKTLEIVEKRGYNLTIEKLSEYLIGGKININDLKKNIKNFKDIDFDGTFIATKGNLKAEKCKKRKKTNEILQPIYSRVLKEYVNDFVKFCPWTQCIMISGSMATDGLGENDDIDINIVVKDFSKYKCYLLALLISLKYSIKYKKLFNAKYFNFLKKVICINVIWEEHQVLPFIRKDGQIAYELINAKILYNPEFFSKMLDHNKWLNNWFPQIYERDYFSKKAINKKSNKKSSKFIEYISMKLFFCLFKIVKMTRTKNKILLDRMDYVESVKHPYGFFDIPKR